MSGRADIGGRSGIDPGRWVLAGLLLWWGVPEVWAQACASNPNATQTSAMQSFVDVVLAVSTVIGVSITSIGIYGLRKAAENNQFTYTQALAGMGAGILMLSAWPLFQIIQTTLLPDTAYGECVRSMTTHPFAVPDLQGPNMGSSGFAQYLPTNAGEILWNFLYLIGIVAYFRGFFLLRRAGEPSQAGQPTAMTTGLTHIFGGFLLINIGDVGCLIADALEFQMLCP